MFEVRISDSAHRDIDECAAWMGGYSQEFMSAQLDRLDGVFRRSIAQSPTTWGYFFVTGAPYHAYFFSVGRRTGYWIVYTIDEEARRVDVLRFWNASRDTKAFSA